MIPNYLIYRNVQIIRPYDSKTHRQIKILTITYACKNHNSKTHMTLHSVTTITNLQAFATPRDCFGRAPASICRWAEQDTVPIIGEDHCKVCALIAYTHKVWTALCIVKAIIAVFKPSVMQVRHGSCTSYSSRITCDNSKVIFFSLLLNVTINL